MDLDQVLRAILLLGVVLNVMGFGAGMTLEDAAHLLRRRALLVRSLLAMHLVLPLIVIWLVMGAAIRPAVALTLLSLAVAPEAPFAPGRQLALADQKRAYVYGLFVVESVLAILLAPLVLALLMPHLPAAVRLHPREILYRLTLTTSLPMLLGVYVRYCWPARARSLAGLANTVGELVLLAGLVAVLMSHWQDIAAVLSGRTVLCIAAFIAAGLAVGQLLGGSDREERTVLALATSLRHPGVALALADPRSAELALVPAVVVLVILIGAVMIAAYSRWRRLRGLAGSA
jgi:BASS family bile acid:Na+ symporter